MEFKTLAQALSYLKKGGWKISKTRLYEDRHLIGDPIFKKNIDNYASRYLSKIDGDNEHKDAAKLLRLEQAKNEREKRKINELKRKRLRGSLVDRHEVEQGLANRAAFLKSSMEGFFHSMTPRLIERCNGDLQRVPEIMEFCLAELEKLFDYYSKPLTFSVPINEEADR